MAASDTVSFDPLPLTSTTPAHDTATAGLTAVIGTAATAPTRDAWQTRRVRDLVEADRLLNQLYGAGAVECELLVPAPSVYVVRWQ
ncbi:MAG: hypothetical protein JWO38_5490 [Gemmataceae bacterium]|nr:hypothetical protein [Gemmataceae bacterium]